MELLEAGRAAGREAEEKARRRLNTGSATGLGWHAQRTCSLWWSAPFKVRKTARAFSSGSRSSSELRGHARRCPSAATASALTSSSNRDSHTSAHYPRSHKAGIVRMVIAQDGAFATTYAAAPGEESSRSNARKEVAAAWGVSADVAERLDARRDARRGRSQCRTSLSGPRAGGATTVGGGRRRWRGGGVRPGCSGSSPGRWGISSRSPRRRVRLARCGPERPHVSPSAYPSGRLHTGARPRKTRTGP